MDFAREHAQLSILIVDDSRALCQLLEAMLNDYGVHQVEHCNSGDEAFAKVSQNPDAYDALFVDLHMEGMDGLELMHELHNIRYRGGIVVMSALDRKILEFTLEVVSNYNLRVLGCAEKPLEKTLIAFMIKRIRGYFHTPITKDKLLKRREVFEAIKTHRVLSYFQPKISAVDNSLIGLESLVRLDSPQGILSPALFMSVAERFDLIDALTEASLSVALPQFMEFCEQQDSQCTLAINISPLQLYNDLLPEFIEMYIDRYQVPKDQIILEVTENHAIREEKQLKNLNRLRIHGFKLSLDDFGSGFTNLRQLKLLPFNEIKLDAQLVDGIHTDKVLKIIVESVRNVTRETGQTLIAEGVSDSKDLLVANDIGVDGYQGFLFCRPKPLPELTRWYHAWQKTIDTAGIHCV